MNRRSLFKNKGFGRLGLILTLPFIVLVIAYGAYQMFLIPDPVVDGLENFSILPEQKSVRINTENVRSIDIVMFQNGKEVSLLSDKPETGDKTYTLEVKPADMGLSDGRAIISVKAEAGMLKKTEFDLESVIDTVPPNLTIIGAPSTVDRGSGGLIKLRASGEDEVYVRLVDRKNPENDRKFRAYPVQSQAENEEKPAKGASPSLYYTFFPAPYDIQEGSVYYAVARDKAGNESIRVVPTRLKMKHFKASTITIDDSFINRVISPLLNEPHIPDAAAAFRKVNEEWRQESAGKLIEISGESSSSALWNGRFLQMRNSKVMATYGDRRTYRYKGKQISKSVHLGYDLASHARAPVEAANAGIVRYADNLSIYGYTVIIDHGLGLMSLYGHLSSIAVEQGETVKKGQIIARSGASGLAGGDHLHFSILMHGFEVSPIYWWDAKWVRLNVLDMLDQRT